MAEDFNEGSYYKTSFAAVQSLGFVRALLQFSIRFATHILEGVSDVLLVVNHFYFHLATTSVLTWIPLLLHDACFRSQVPRGLQMLAR